ncbi:hypothetical protein QUF81_25120 [Peribacillus simplex]|uniref:Uncharacterized protein n=1 Tax=Peribacillus simplex TaxID=1478 RepID=A0AAW7IN27_9BACI|nr:hypothetical protein [Peribacillus simplex]MDM5296368.1 hypothetical protein [Peribacillus simplex]MDM5455422.1 hypothetical protein [Peribacillus simplex]
MVEKAYQKDSEFKRWIFAPLWLGVGGAALALKNPEMRKAALKVLTKGKANLILNPFVLFVEYYSLFTQLKKCINATVDS